MKVNQKNIFIYINHFELCIDIYKMQMLVTLVTNIAVPPLVGVPQPPGVCEAAAGSRLTLRPRHPRRAPAVRTKTCWLGPRVRLHIRAEADLPVPAAGSPRSLNPVCTVAASRGRAQASGLNRVCTVAASRGRPEAVRWIYTWQLRSICDLCKSLLVCQTLNLGVFETVRGLLYCHGNWLDTGN